MTSVNHLLLIFMILTRNKMCLLKMPVMVKHSQLSVIKQNVNFHYFEYDANDNIVYSCGKGRFIIDLKKKKANKIIYENIGNDFFVESVENINYGRKIKFGDIEIGKKWCRFDNAQTTKGYAAFQNDM